MKYILIAAFVSTIHILQAQTLDSLIILDNYTCIMLDLQNNQESSCDYFIDDTGIFLMFLSDYSSTDYTPFDFNSDGSCDTQDLLKALSGFNYTLTDWPPFEVFTPGDIFGEGNQWLTSNSAAISFGWMHRTPADEIDVWYNGWDLVSFKLDVIYIDQTIKSFTFLNKSE